MNKTFTALLCPATALAFIGLAQPAAAFGPGGPGGPGGGPGGPGGGSGYVGTINISAAGPGPGSVTNTIIFSSGAPLGMQNNVTYNLGDGIDDGEYSDSATCNKDINGADQVASNEKTELSAAPYNCNITENPSNGINPATICGPSGGLPPPKYCYVTMGAATMSSYNIGSYKVVIESYFNAYDGQVPMGGPTPFQYNVINEWNSAGSCVAPVNYQHQGWDPITDSYSLIQAAQQANAQKMVQWLQQNGNGCQTGIIDDTGGSPTTCVNPGP